MWRAHRGPWPLVPAERRRLALDQRGGFRGREATRAHRNPRSASASPSLLSRERVDSSCAPPLKEPPLTAVYESASSAMKPNVNSSTLPAMSQSPLTLLPAGRLHTL